MLLKKLEKERGVREKLKIEEIVLRKTLDESDPNFDRKLECLLKTSFYFLM